MTGATGFVGGATMRDAVAAGWHVRALTRRPQPARDGVTWVAGALDDKDSLAEMAKGSDVVMHIAGVVNVPTRAAFEAGNATATANVVDAARGAGVTRFIHVSSLAAREPGISNYGWSKERAEAVVMASGLDWTIVRPPAVFGPGDTEMLDLFRMARRGIALVPSGRMSAIYVDELARLLVTLAADRGASIGQIYEPDDGKPTGWSHRGFARAVARAVGRQRLSTVATPALLLRAGGRLDKLVRRSRAKLTPDRARYIAHPDWVATEGACPPAALWRPERDTDDALAETVRWYRREGWL
ncbi:epimerase [Sphingopyxis sp. H038]|uniref:NAD-dependent epimerase/dehydratase family protein n=1 Tax=unclassified Sphingopyxis TaxID=2614943 RepID=UPI0007305BFF|nr:MULTISPECIES: NAD(P)H-binding protein [unclassified Sphingopyxis]KTE01364.1 epimerase [Sphingopyxis sp. H012]KTE07536.1 epimerase [Sphingopyxis sp. H093]KTE12708.1 epimerase [Sphingopyxis sp. H053]KTE24872.1 epimerase [Sphingopyxis sp. H080]KTE31964.1 epimerase [Sphingopyxis sp. H038]